MLLKLVSILIYRLPKFRSKWRQLTEEVRSVTPDDMIKYLILSMRILNRACWGSESFRQEVRVSRVYEEEKETYRSNEFDARMLPGTSL